MVRDCALALRITGGQGVLRRASSGLQEELYIYVGFEQVVWQRCVAVFVAQLQEFLHRRITSTCLQYAD